MLLEGSCHCGSVRFSVESAHPYPFNLCYCSICRKTAGGGGFAINLSATSETLRVQGRENIQNQVEEQNLQGQEGERDPRQRGCGYGQTPRDLPRP